MMRFLLIGLFGVTLLTSCGDCYQRVSGRVVDGKTGKPVYGAAVHNKDKVWVETITDSLGRFELSSISGGSSGCPPMKIIVECFGYKKTEESIAAGEQKTIVLE